MTKQELIEENKLLKAKVELLSPKRSETTNTNYQFAFEIEGEKFFKWSTVEDIPLSRKIYIDGFIKSTSMVMDLEEQREVCGKIVQLT